METHKPKVFFLVDGSEVVFLGMNMKFLYHLFLGLNDVFLSYSALLTKDKVYFSFIYRKLVYYYLSESSSTSIYRVCTICAYFKGCDNIFVRLIWLKLMCTFKYKHEV